MDKRADIANFNVKAPRDLKIATKVAAAKLDMSLNAYVIMALHNQLAADEKNE